MARLVKNGKEPRHLQSWEGTKRGLIREGSLMKYNPGQRTKNRFTERFITNSSRPSPQVAGAQFGRAHNSEGKQAEIDENALILLNHGHPEHPVLCTQIGGLRQDPFEMLPTESIGMAPYAFDFCKFPDHRTEDDGHSSYCLLATSRHSIRALRCQDGRIWQKLRPHIHRRVDTRSDGSRIFHRLYTCYPTCGPRHRSLHIPDHSELLR